MEELITATLETALDTVAMCTVLTFVVQGRFGKKLQLRHLSVEHLQRRIVRYVVQIFDPEKELI